MSCQLFRVKGSAASCFDAAWRMVAGVVSTVISEAAQPISNALYTRHGMYQWMPLIHVELPSIPRDLAQTTQAVTGRVAPSGDAAVLAALDRIDSSVLGFTRPVDHRFWLDLPDLTLLLLGPAPDQPTAYAYVSSFGGIGPCAASHRETCPHCSRTSCGWRTRRVEPTPASWCPAWRRPRSRICWISAAALTPR